MINEITILLTLASIHFIALMSPGPDFALVVQNSTRHGRQTGIYIALGLSLGIFVHSFFSLTGISYLVHQQPTLFAFVQFVGGSYLTYLGYGAIKATIININHTDNEDAPAPNLVLNNKKEALSKGFITNILNPKALVFFISLMSSLVPADMSYTGKAIALFILWALSFFWFALLAWMLSTKKLQAKLKDATIYIDGLCGAVFSLAGLTIIWQTLSSFAV